MPVTTPEAVIWMFVPGVRLSPVLVHWTAPVTETVVGRLVLLIPTADASGDSEESPMLLAEKRENEYRNQPAIRQDPTRH